MFGDKRRRFYGDKKDGKIVNDVAAEGMIAIVRAIGLMK